MKRLQVARSWDFNQMLVASVSGHLLLITFVLFLPKTTLLEEILPPAFMVELVEVSQGKKKPASKPPKKPVKKKKTPVPTETVKAPTPLKPIVPPKLIEPIQQFVKLPPKQKTPEVKHSASDQILNRLDKLKNPPTNLDKNFDQLAMQVPKPPVIEKSKPILEKTFDETSAKKNLLDQFESLNMKDTLDVEPPPEPAVVKKPESSLKELEFASLSKYTEKLDTKQDEKSSADLLKELTEMKQPTFIDKQPVIPESLEAKAPPVTQEKSQVFDSILKKLDSLDTKPKDVDMNVAVPETVAQSYESDIRKVSVPKQVQMDLVISPNQAYVQSSTPGKPGADALALYKGMIIKKVMENWNAPLGQNHDKRVVISFNIYPKGNIDRPDLEETSHVELLDNLALRAIRESEPFPEFPESLESSNLNISIHFKYIQEKNKT
jgi:TonB family protein